MILPHRRRRSLGRISARWRLTATTFALVATFAAACTPTTATSSATSGLERQPDGWRGLDVGDKGLRLFDATFTGTDGEPVELPEALLGTPTLMFFGYTNCPDICPIHLGAIASAMRTLDIGYDQIDVVFVTVDPDRDTPEVIEGFLAHFDRRMIGLHADTATTMAALTALELPGPVVEGPDPRGKGDLLGHPAQVIGFDADGVMRRMWPFGTRRSDWVDDLPRVIEAWS